MNGVRLLLVFAAATQLGVALLAAQVADPFPMDSSRDFGWQIKEGVLEYIVQISPEKAMFMQQNGEENLSDMPPELVGRVQRIVVRVGNDILPKSPSKEEIQRTVPPYMSPNDVTASLGAGKFSDLESNSIVNVQGSALPYPGLPDAPTGAGGQSGMALPPGTQPSRPGDFQTDSRGGLSQRFLSDSMAPPPNTSPPTNQFPSTSPAPSTLPQTNNPSLLAAGTQKYNNTAPGGATNGMGARNGSGTPGMTNNPGGGWPGSNNNAAGNNGSGNNGNGNGNNWNGNNNNSADGFSGLPSSMSNNGTRTYDPPAFGVRPPELGSNNTFSQQAPSSWGSSPGMSPLAGNDFAGGNRDASGGNRTYGATQPNSGYGGSGYGGSGYGSPNSSSPNSSSPNFGGSGYGGRGELAGNQPGMSGNSFTGQDGVTRMASNPNLAGSNPSNPNPGSYQNNVDTNQNRQSSPSDDLAGSNGASHRGSIQRSSDVWLQIFFLVSLIVNFYLGMLIRKLLTRYRSLLSSVRGQAA